MADQLRIVKRRPLTPPPPIEIPLSALDPTVIEQAALEPGGVAPEVSTPGPQVVASRTLPDEPWILRTAKRVVPTALRVGGAVVGGVAGSFAGPGVGTAIGGALGAGGGEALAEQLEIATGQRTRINPAQVATQAVLGAVPILGRPASVARTVLSRAAQGATLGGVASAATDIAEGQTPTLERVATGAGLGAAVGGGAGRLEAALRRPRLVPRVETPPAVDVPPAAAQAPPVDAPVPPAAAQAPPVDSPVPPRTPPVEPPAAVAAGPTIVRRRSITDIERQAAALGEPIPEARMIQAANKVEDRMVAKFPEAMRAEARELLEQHGGFTRQRREVQPIARQQAIARYLTVERQKLAPGTILNTEETIALGNAIANVQDEITPLAERVASGVASNAEKLRLEQLRLDHVVLWANEVGVAAEQGRALGARRFLREALATRDDLLLDETLRRVRPENIDAFARAWAQAPDDLTRLKLARDAEKMTKWEAFTAWRYSNMLSGLRTSFRNIFGTGSNGVFRSLGHLPAVGYDIGEAAVLKRPRTIFLGEATPKTFGAIAGIPIGLKNALFTLKHGIGPRAIEALDIPRKELKGEITRYGFGKASVPVPEALRPVNRVVAKASNLSGRFLDAQDQAMFEFFHGAEFAGRLYAKVRAEGLAKGLRGEALATHIQQGVAEGHVQPPPDVTKAAREATLEVLYREEPGPMLKSLMALKEQPGWKYPLHFLIPFTKIAGNVLRQSLENVPGGALLMPNSPAGRALRAGGRGRAEVIGRETVGGIGLATLLYWASQGKVSGHGPTNPAERATLMAEGWRPNSVKIGNTWVDYTIMFQPLAAPLFTIANLWERMHKTGEAPSENDVVALTFAVANSMTDQSFLSGLSDFNNAVSDPDRYAANYVGRVTQSVVVPYAGLARNVAQAIDPVIREPKGTAEAVASIVPGMTSTVTPKLDIFGQPATRAGGAVWRGFSPVTVQTESKDPVIAAMRTLGVTMGAPPKTLQKTRTQPAIDLTTAERQQIGRVSKDAADRLVRSGAFQALMRGNDEAAARALRQAIDRVREREYGRIRQARRRAR